MRHVAYKTCAQGRLARQRGDFETNNTTARPQQGTAETDDTSAPEKHAKNSHFSPAKAMAVSIARRRKRGKATGVSDHQAASPAAPKRGPSGRRGLAAAPVGSNDTTAS